MAAAANGDLIGVMFFALKFGIGAAGDMVGSVVVARFEQREESSEDDRGAADTVTAQT